MVIASQADTSNIDKIDRQILKILMDDSRTPYAKVAEKVGLSRVAVAKRIRSLVVKGVIQKFTVQVPSEYVRKPLPVFFDLKFSPVHVAAAAQRIAAQDDVVTVYQMSARNSLHVHGFFTDISEVNSFIDRFIANLPGIQSVGTDFLMCRFKSNFV